MRRIVLPLFAVFTALMALARPGSAAPDPCDDLASVDESQQTLLWNIAALLGQEEVPPDRGGYGADDYYVTVRPGRFANVSCNANEYEFQEMYPIGVVVKPLYRIELDSYPQGRTPVMVLTEYGHRKIIAQEDIQKLVENASYIFADSYAKAMICRAGEACPGNAEDICTEGRCRYDISAFWGYAIAPSGDAAVRAATGAYAGLRRDPLIRSRLEGEALAAAKAAVCQPFPVKAYLPGGALAQPGDSYLTLCSKRQSEGADADGLAPLKIVDMASARKVFSFHLDGSFHRRFGESMSGFSERLSDLSDARLTVTKGCGVEVKDVGILKYGGGFSAKANAGGLVEVRLGADLSIAAEISATLGKDDFMLFSTYFIQPIPIGANAPPQGGEGEFWLFKIVFKARCENSVPAKATSILVFYERLDAGYVEIAAKGQLFESYQKDWRNLSFVENSDPHSLQDGKFWKIVDHVGYFVWRDTLRTFFFEGIPGTYDLLLKYPEEQRPLVRDFFVYLILTAAYHHRDPQG